jgi:hypothetical protein
MGRTTTPKRAFELNFREKEFYGKEQNKMLQPGARRHQDEAKELARN